MNLAHEIQQLAELRARGELSEEEFSQAKERLLAYRKGIRRRSSSRIFGLPLWSIALGPDPERGESRGHARGIFALGDINGGPAFTHISYDDFRILRTNLIEKGSATTRGRLVPYTVFIDPQLGRIGLTEAEARAQQKNIRVASLPMSSVARALEADETRGFMKAIVDAETGQILGAAVLGLEGGEIMSMLQLAMIGKLRDADLRDGIFAHPTLAESLNNLFRSS